MCIGKTPNGEIDFIATRQNDKLYIQITKEIKSEKTEKREYDRLLEINDNYPKYLLTTDDFAGGQLPRYQDYAYCRFPIVKRILNGFME